MAEFLTTSGTSFQIERIMIGAKNELVLISPYLKLTKTFFERLQDASKKGIEIRIIYGKDELNPTEEKQIKSLENIELYFSKNLHAKCYYNESEMVITSMNMYEFSEKNNREMGVHLTKEIDKKVFEDATSEALSIKNNAIFKYKAEKITQPITKDSNQKVKKEEFIYLKAPKKGICIRCAAEMDFNILRPICNKCYKVWCQFRNEDYVENYCHKCKKPIESTFAKPLCRDCFRELPKETRNILERAR